MKKHISSLVFGTVGMCAGCVLCFVYLVLPTREPVERGREAEQAMKAFSTLTATLDGYRESYVMIP